MSFFHAALSVNNLEESMKFYIDLFDLKVKAVGERPELGVKFVILVDSNGAGVELFQHVTPTRKEEDPMDFSNVGMKHVAFYVADVDKIFEKALKMGAKQIWDPRKGVTVKRLAFIKDPNGIAVELVQI